MLTVLRRVFSFRDWYTNHPNEPPPGDMLDASFDAQNSKISEIEALVGSVRRPDGALLNGIVTKDSLDPETYGDLRHEMRLAAHFELKRAQEQVELAREAAESALSAQKRAEISEISSRADAAIVNTAKSDQMRQINALIAESRAISAELRSAEAQLADTEDYVGYSEAWAESSRLWAEHMPDTLPDNALKMMDITGDHWSSRWWAHKAAGAFGSLSELYLGAHPIPPSSTSTGDPIPIGGIYYNTETGQMYVWDGSQWVSMTQPQRAGLAALWYNATEGQTAFPFATTDLNGRNYTLSIDATEGVDAHVNGVKLMPKEGPTEGDWTLNNATSTVTFLRPLRSGDIVSFDILMANEKLGPGEVNTWSLALTEPQDGVRTSFTLDMEDAGGPAVTVGKNEELIVSFDGVIQEPGVGYSASGTSITFTTPPAADVRIFITWFRSEGGTGAIDFGIEEAPIDGQQYARSDAAWEVVTGGSGGGGGSTAWADITGKPSTFPPTLPIAQSGITNLVSDLSGKAAAVHTHAQADITNLTTDITAAKARVNHTGTQSADTLTDGTTNKAFLATERTKLSGIATAATANSTDAVLLARANHTGTQLAATISDFNTAADARVALKITNKLTVASSAPGSPATNDVWIDTT